MSLSLEHDYIGLSEISVKENSDKNNSSSATLSSEEEEKNNVFNLKQTELRLGLPGSESPERGIGLSLSVKGVVEAEKNNINNGFSSLKNFVSGAKRGFSDAIDGSNKWGFSGNAGSEVDLGKGGALFSPRGGNGGKSLGGLENSTTTTTTTQQSGSASNAMKDSVPPSPKPVQENKSQIASSNDQSPPAKAQVVGWPPIRSFRKNTMAANPSKNNTDGEGKSGSGCMYVKVSMDGAPYLRKVDLKMYANYKELSAALEKMFSCFTIGQCGSHGVPGRDGLSESRLMDLLHGSECVLTYEDKDGDWMLVGDVPWERLRIMKGSEAIGLAPRAMEKCKNRN
ncbi:hypothetical protein AQUCO_00100366v1 [Aquilegia coerulea]|uniref:Auxin-responsive protein n=2 Tax=Aquilegia coerulea TaxID=218851 RepID=A0A2G5FA05_AQUCA|nr:hypothetical protein AQUCO_00100366v1 [Aquilegia coerulea]